LVVVVDPLEVGNLELVVGPSLVATGISLVVASCRRVGSLELLVQPYPLVVVGQIDRAAVACQIAPVAIHIVVADHKQVVGRIDQAAVHRT